MHTAPLKRKQRGYGNENQNLVRYPISDLGHPLSDRLGVFRRENHLRCRGPRRSEQNFLLRWLAAYDITRYSPAIWFHEEVNLDKQSGNNPGIHYLIRSCAWHDAAHVSASDALRRETSIVRVTARVQFRGHNT
jgi:hypothetical protein